MWRSRFALNAPSLCVFLACDDVACFVLCVHYMHSQRHVFTFCEAAAVCLLLSPHKQVNRCISIVRMWIHYTQCKCILQVHRLCKAVCVLFVFIRDSKNMMKVAQPSYLLLLLLLLLLLFLRFFLGLFSLSSSTFSCDVSLPHSLWLHTHTAAQQSRHVTCLVVVFTTRLDRIIACSLSRACVVVVASLSCHKLTWR